MAERETLPNMTPAMVNILLALAGGELHGYGIMQEVAARTDGATRLGPGTLYRSIKQMLALGLIAESSERPDPTLDDERRRYYRLTDLGLRTLQTEMRRLEDLVQTARFRKVLPGDAGIASAGTV